MLCSIEYKGYVVYAFAKPWAGLMWIGGYVISAKHSGEQMRNYPEAALRESPNEACNAAVIKGQQYIDLMLPEIA